MCLRKATFALKWSPENNRFIGEGYKSLEEEYLKRFKVNKWYRASGDYLDINYWSLNKLAKSDKIFADNSKLYLPGFHIFLRQSDADNYRFRAPTYEVIYSNVLAYGTNVNGFSAEAYGPCVIAEYMKIVRKIS
jgi:hypothetical protein